MTSHEFSKTFISRFVDNDLDAKDQSAFIRHKAQCPNCFTAEARFRQAGMIFESQAEAMAGQLLKETPEIFIKTGNMGHHLGIDRITKRKSQRRQAVLGMVSFAVVAVMMYLFPWHQEQQPIDQAIFAPSAMVNSVDAYGSSVMILDTAETHHTIIWFSET